MLLFFCVHCVGLNMLQWKLLAPTCFYRHEIAPRSRSGSVCMYFGPLPHLVLSLSLSLSLSFARAQTHTAKCAHTSTYHMIHQWSDVAACCVNSSGRLMATRSQVRALLMGMCPNSRHPIAPTPPMHLRLTTTLPGKGIAVCSAPRPVGPLLS